MNRFLILFCLSLFLFSCKTQNVLQTSKPKKTKGVVDSVFLYDSTYQYTVRRDDKLNISIWGQDDLSVGSIYGVYNSNEVYGKWLMVDANGNIEIPQVGTVKVIGKTIPQIKDTLKQIHSLRLVNPIVDVKVLNREITVLGEVRNSGVHLVDKENNTLFDLIAKSGGFEFYANIKYIKVLRQEGENVRVANIDLTKYSDYLLQNIQLHPGDIVLVPSKKMKEFDKRVSTVILPLTSTISAASILYSTFFKLY